VVDTPVVGWTKPTLIFKLWNDDQITGDVPMPDTSDLERVFNPAYVLPVFDVGDSNDNVEFKLNLQTAQERQDAFDWNSKGYNTNNFWVGYILGSYQHATTEDRDPNNEGGVYGSTFSTEGGCHIYIESHQESVSINAEIQDSVDHEIGHLFGSSDSDGGLMGQVGSIPREYSPTTINKIRNISKPAG